MKACVLTGATGFIGTHVARALVKAGWTVHALLRATSNRAELTELKESLHFHVWDGCMLDTFFRSVAPIQAVVHVATNYGRGTDAPSTLAATNTLRPLELLETAIRHQVPLVVNTDTCFTTDYKYLRPYTLSKKQLVQWGQILCDGTNDTRFVNLVLQHPYGPGDRPSKFAPAMIQQCLTSTDTINLTPGEQKKDFVYVGDVAAVYELVLAKVNELPPGFSQFEVGSGSAISIREFVEAIHRIANSSAKLHFGGLTYRDGEIMFSQADITAICNLGWRPATTLDHGLQLTIHSVKKSIPPQIT